jgi:hypothetical protein
LILNGEGYSIHDMENISSNSQGLKVSEFISYGMGLRNSGICIVNDNHIALLERLQI